MFSAQLPLATLSVFCRTLRHSLSAGLSIVRVFQQQADRGPSAVKPVARRIADQLESGESLEEALKAEKRSFPMMFVSLVAVGEKTGNLPEVLEALEDYFELQLKLWRDFKKQIAWPAIQFFIVPFVIAGMIFLLSILSSGNKPWDPLGFGLTGTVGAIKFLIYYFGTFACFIALYFIFTRAMKQAAVVHEILLRLWAVGPCLRAIALTRFCIALRLTMNSGMSIANAVKLSMRATGNEAFVARAEIVREAVKSGDDLTEALAQAKVFPIDLLDIVANAEEGGRVPEVMEHQAKHYADESRRRMSVLTQVASWSIYGLVAAMIIFLIFSIFSSYLSLLGSFGA